MSNTEITREQTPHEIKFCKNPAFYVWGYGHHFVAKINHKDREVGVYCDGEMRISLWESKEARERGDEPQVIRQCDRLREASITTDAELYKAEDEGRLEWVNNSWFDLYDRDNNAGDGGWLDCVHHDLDEAIDQAQALVSNDEEWARLCA